MTSANPSCISYKSLCYLRDDEASVDIKELFNEATEGDIENVGKM
jgi:hypothetical protein